MVAPDSWRLYRYIESIPERGDRATPASIGGRMAVAVTTMDMVTVARRIMDGLQSGTAGRRTRPVYAGRVGASSVG